MYSDVETFPEVSLGKKTNKPLMEKKRRARINRCLSELKEILIKDNHVSASHAKWEKADILEMTVDYVKKLRSSKGGQNELKRPKVEEPDEIAKSPGSICTSPPSTSSTEFIEAPEAKRQRRCDKEPGPVQPIPTYAGIHPHLLAQHFLFAQIQNQAKMGSIAPNIFSDPSFTSFTASTLPATVSPWR